MRIKTFTAPTMADAMEEVRRVMGPDAIIISTHEGTRGAGVEIRAAVERLPEAAPAPVQEAEPADPMSTALRENLRTFAPHLSKQLDNMAAGSNKVDPDVKASQADTLKQVLAFHGCSKKLGSVLLSTYGALEETDLKEALCRVLELRFPITPIAAKPVRPIILVGPAGSGKTAVAAKLAARCVLSGGNAQLVSTDTVRAGALAQLSEIAEIMGHEVVSCESPAELTHFVEGTTRQYESPSIIIDTPATNPYVASEMEDLKAFIQASHAEPVLVLPAGGDRNELKDMAEAFATLGVQRVIVTRVDATRRIGSILSAIDGALLTLSHFSDSPFVGRGFRPFSPEEIADKLLTIPKKIAEPTAPEQAQTIRKNVS